LSRSSFASLLLRCFQAMDPGLAKMMSGARALSAHCHRALFGDRHLNLNLFFA
jgi:hypothetical protein